MDDSGEVMDRLCEWPGCDCAAEHRAPRSRERLRDYRWFCVEHVRAYNRAWNYYAGMTDAEVEAAIRSDTTWNRPSWPFGGAPDPDQKSAYIPGDFGNMRDPFDLFEDSSAHSRPDAPALSEPELRAVRVLDLEFPFTAADVKARYKVLVKRYHPDATGGDKTAEERFKKIHEAYQTVMNSLQA